MQNQFISLLRLVGAGRGGAADSHASFFFVNSTLCWSLWPITSDGIDPNCKRRAPCNIAHSRTWLINQFSTLVIHYQIYFFCKTAQLKEVIKNSEAAKNTFVWLIISLTFFFLLNKVNNTCYHSKLNCISCQVIFILQKPVITAKRLQHWDWLHSSGMTPRGIWPMQRFPLERSAASTVTWRSWQKWS